MATLHGVPQGGELWKVGSSSYIIYEVDPPGQGNRNIIRLAYRVDTQDKLRNLTSDNIDYDRTISWDQWRRLGIVNGGYSDNLAGEISHPWDRYMDEIKRQSRTQPWLLEDDILALGFEAFIEGRANVTTEELQRTDWWRSRTDAQRRWLITLNSDPQTARQQLNTQRLNTAELLKQAGVSGSSRQLIDYLSDRYVKGDISAAQLREEIKIVSDPHYSGHYSNNTLLDLIDAETGLDRTHEGEDRIREIIVDYMGIGGLRDFSNDDIGRRAHDLREDPDFEQQFIERIKGMKNALYPTQNREATWAEMATPWKNMTREMWGTDLMDDDTTLQKLIQRNDLAFGEEFLRREGRKRNIEGVMQPLREEIFNMTSGGTRRAVR